VDDSVSACSRPWVDAEDSHGQRLGSRADDPAAAYAAMTTARRTVVTWPKASVTVTRAVYLPARV